jgi:hypothetical protein
MGLYKTTEGIVQVFSVSLLIQNMWLPNKSKTFCIISLALQPYTNAHNIKNQCFLYVKVSQIGRIERL